MPRWDGDSNAEWWMLLLRQQAQSSSSLRGRANREEKALYELLPRETEGFDSQSIFTAPDQTCLFQTSSSLEVFTQPSRSACPCPDSCVLQAIGAHS